MTYDNDQTVIRPRPGYRPGTGVNPPLWRDTTAPPPPPPPPFTEPSPLARGTISPQSVESYSWNILVNAAAPLFFLATQIRNTASHSDLLGLRERFIRDLGRFDQESRRSGEPAELLRDARYALCTFVDEAVLNTPWGSDSTWQEESLLSTFFNETWGGDRFFTILDQAKQQPGRTYALLEILFICLMLGFEGKYHVLDRGKARLEEVRDDLYQILRAQRSEFERALSPHWQGVAIEGRRISDHLPLWALAAIAAALLTAIYLAFRMALGGATYPVFDSLSRIGRDALSTPPVEIHKPEPTEVLITEQSTPSPEPSPPPVSKLRWTDLLGPQIDAGLLSVKQEGLRSLIQINSDTLFPSGSATVEERFIPILAKIAQALDTVSGHIQIIGHSDNVPIHTVRFPSNWELSRERAVNVQRQFDKYIRVGSRMTTEGRADTEPLTLNDTPANRALNRRVEILLFEHESP